MTDPLRPPDTDDEPWDAFYRALDDRERLRRDRSRDLALLAFAGLVLLALLAWGMTTPWNT